MLDLKMMLIYYLQSYNINHTSLFVQKKEKLSMWWKKYQLPSKSNEVFLEVGKPSETERVEYDPGKNLKYDDLVNIMTLLPFLKRDSKLVFKLWQILYIIVRR